MLAAIEYVVVCCWMIWFRVHLQIKWKQTASSGSRRKKRERDEALEDNHPLGQQVRYSERGKLNAQTPDQEEEEEDPYQHDSMNRYNDAHQTVNRGHNWATGMASTRLRLDRFSSLFDIWSKINRFFFLGEVLGSCDRCLCKWSRHHFFSFFSPPGRTFPLNCSRRSPHCFLYIFFFLNGGSCNVGHLMSN